MNIFSNISKSKISRYFFLYTAFPLFWFYKLHTLPTQSSLSGIVGSLHFLYQLLTLVDSFRLQALCMFGYIYIYIYFIHFLGVLHVFLIFLFPSYVFSLLIWSSSFSIICQKTWVGQLALQQKDLS